MNKPELLKIAIFAPYYEHVGTEKVMLTLAKGFAKRGNEVDLIRADREWPDFKNKDRIRVVDLNAKHFINFFPKRPSYRPWNILLTLELLPKLIQYLRREKPDVFISGLLGTVGVVACKLSLTSTRIILSIQGLPRVSSMRKLLWKYTYPYADIIVVPAKGIDKAINEVIGEKKSNIKIIHNPVIDDSILEKAQEPVDHPWFRYGQQPIVLGVGRLTHQKDFPTLLRAFAKMREKLEARLVIIGEGEDRPKLEELAKKLKIAKEVDMPGFVDNPYKYMKKADVFVLSSRWEGPGHVPIEAQALKTPVVATDCPTGPRDTLLEGKAGLLVRVGDDKAMANAISQLLKDSRQAKQYVEIGYSNIDRFYPRNVVKRYLSIIKKLIRG